MRESSESSDESGFDEMAAAFSEDAAAHGLNPDLKQSIRKFKKFSLHKGTKEDERSSPGMEDPSSVVKFDPRITITEYTDEKERIWYSDRELNYFKNESLMLAQQYILLNPSIAEKFLKGSYDPVTGRLKKAALYSLPVLNCLPDDFDPETFNKQLQEMLDNGVKRILIVDPNNVILQLFSKMFHEMFPGTNVVTVESAEDALREYTMALVKGHKDPKHRTSFDIIVVEQKLAHHRRQRTTGTSVRVNFEPKDQTVSSTSQLQALVGGSPHGQLHPPRKASFSTLGSLNRYSGGHGMSGSQLIKKIRQLEDQAYGHIARKSDGETSKASESRSFQRCIIIGVSTSAREDSSILYEGGADLVWSKPPPPVGVQLRNQLLSALVTKRNGTGLRISQYNRTQSL
jgi:CheY-like chemotaxis protein